VWYGTPEWKGSEFEDRYGCEIVCVGEMEVGWGKTQIAGPSFGVETTRGLLSCGVSEDLPLFFFLPVEARLNGRRLSVPLS